ncbi:MULTISPECIES: hypothetical protein [Flavobacterium]|jgi:hypothetical protein|uniref:DUF4251 domain-containing protein n=1 Tax=Flavobacterium cupriresistens TaxID=2893885 RepID=A0ABU4RHU4_9FLAO|nr:MULTISPECIES: hypothetical protein [unclassified Flavobacterium]KLT68995.1 hypothetical protein AB674_14280 [Flavobacterium sp. ABG]MDX6190980.1 hypothetical protein [Flavobacterium sp. Fl-318]UFH43849.1 hypothetical protein LNP23_06430 [Flavobacterium sp. F-323]
MRNYYALILLLFFVSVSHAQQSQKTLVVDKAWVNDSEEWSDFKYAGQIVFSTNASNEEGTLRIGNYDFLYDICEGKAKFANKATYSAAEFAHPRKVSVTTDKQGVVNSTYEGTLIFQADKDYYSVIAVVTLLEKEGNMLGVKMHLKDNNAREYAFSLKPNS